MEDFLEITGEDVERSITNLEQLVFEVTDACNLRCKYCAYADFYEGYDERENILFPFHKAKLIIDYLHEIWRRNYQKDIASPLTIGFYGGEPLLNVSFIKQVVSYVEGLPYVGKKIHYNMTTNGVLLNRHMDYLIEKEFRLLISLDGNKEGHSYRIDADGKNSFDMVYANVQFLKTKAPDYFNRFVRFNSVLHNRNSVRSIYDFIKEHFGKKTNIAPLNDSGIRENKKEEFKKTYKNIQESFNDAVSCSSFNDELSIEDPKSKTLTKYIYFNSGNIYASYNNLFYDTVKNSTKHRVGTCVPFSKKMFITVKGRILQCERIDHDFTLGHVADDKIILDFDEVASIQNSYVKKLIHTCLLCALVGQCSQCIYYVKDILTNKPKCKGFITANQLNRRYTETLNHLDKNPQFYKKILKDIILR